MRVVMKQILLQVTSQMGGGTHPATSDEVQVVFSG